jgi:acetyl-CoA acetyltransferase
MIGAYVYAAVRTPFGKLGGGLAQVRPDDLAATVLTGLLAKIPGLDPGAIDDMRWTRRCSDTPRSRRPKMPSAGAFIGWADVGAVELNEPFAVQSLACIDAWGIDPKIVNVRGGAIAIGHPLGASGGRILGTLRKVLQERRERWGVAAICIGVGQALAVVVEDTWGELS